MTKSGLSWGHPKPTKKQIGAQWRRYDDHNEDEYGFVRSILRNDWISHLRHSWTSPTDTFSMLLRERDSALTSCVKLRSYCASARTPLCLRVEVCPNLNCVPGWRTGQPWYQLQPGATELATLKRRLKHQVLRQMKQEPRTHHFRMGKARQIQINT